MTTKTTLFDHTQQVKSWEILQVTGMSFSWMLKRQWSSFNKVNHMREISSLFKLNRDRTMMKNYNWLVSDGWVLVTITLKKQSTGRVVGCKAELDVYLPFMKDNDKVGLATVFGDIRASREDDEFWCTNPGPWTATFWFDASSPTTRTLSLNIWTVPLLLETANHLTVGERERLYMSALSAPLRTCISQKLELRPTYTWQVQKCNKFFHDAPI